MSSEEDEGFLLPAFILLWLLAGIGLAFIAERIRALGRTSRLGGGALAAAALVLIVWVPAGRVAANYRANDHHRRTFETRLLDALFRALPAKAAIVEDEYSLNMMILYKLLGEGAAGARDIRRIPRTAEAVTAAVKGGYQVFAFGLGQAELGAYGFTFAPASVPFPDDVRQFLPPEWAPVRLIDATECVRVGNAGWQDVSHLARAGFLRLRIDNYRPFDSRTTIYVEGTPSAPQLTATGGHGEPSLRVTVFEAADWESLARALDADDVPARLRAASSAAVHRVALAVNDDGQFWTGQFDFPAPAARVLLSATVDLNNPARATVCGRITPPE
jgi:hypothetical protein